MRITATLRTAKSVAVVIGLVLNLCVLVALGLFLVASCAPARPRPAYHFRPGPAYLPGAKPYVHERYPIHP
jgi:hypothetical protein